MKNTRLSLFFVAPSKKNNNQSSIVAAAFARSNSFLVFFIINDCCNPSPGWKDLEQCPFAEGQKKQATDTAVESNKIISPRHVSDFGLIISEGYI